MHRLPSKSSVNRFRLSALLIWTVPIVFIGGLGYLTKGMIASDERKIVLAFGAIAVAVILKIIQWIVASKARCPLCMTPSLAHKSCARHRTARTFFGSYRLRTAASVLLKGHFRCPYCGEPTALKVRDRYGRTDYHRRGF